MSATARPGESPTPDPTASQTSLPDNLSVRSSESPQGSRTDVRRISFARDRSGSRRRSNHSSPAGDLDNQIGSLPEVAKTSSNSGTGRRISSPPPPRYVAVKKLACCYLLIKAFAVCDIHFFLLTIPSNPKQYIPTRSLLRHI